MIGSKGKHKDDLPIKISPHDDYKTTFANPDVLENKNIISYEVSVEINGRKIKHVHKHKVRHHEN